MTDSNPCIHTHTNKIKPCIINFFLVFVSRTGCLPSTRSLGPTGTAFISMASTRKASAKHTTLVSIAKAGTKRRIVYDMYLNIVSIVSRD